MFKTKLPPFTVFYQHGEEYHRLKREIFTQGVYYFETNVARLVILDIGAHIGLATLYFKKLYPAAQVTAIEPNPEVFSVLEKNVFENRLQDVNLHQVAVAESAGTREFFLDQTAEQWLSTASLFPGAWNGEQKSRSISVPTMPLTKFLIQPIDFLKMDIEGAEQAVLSAAGDQLQLVKHLIIEFHPMPHQSLSTLIEFLTSQNFSVKLWKDGQEISAKRAHGLVYIEAQLT